MASPWAGIALGAQDAPPPPARTRRCPFKASLLPGRRARRRPRRGGQRHPGYRAGDDDGPWGSSQSLRDARLAAAGVGGIPPGRGGCLRRHVSLLCRCAPPPPAPASRSPGPGRPSRHAGHGRFVLGPAPRASTPGPPHLLRVHWGGALRRQPISAGRPGTASEVLAGGGAGGRTSWGARRREAGGGSGSEERLGSRAGTPAAPIRKLRGSERAGAAGRGAGPA